MKNLIVFDFDGVLIDSLKHIESFDKWLYPSLSDQDWKETSEGNYFQKMLKHEQSRLNVSEEEINEKRKKFYAEKNNCVAFPGIVETIKKLAENNILAINTTSKKAGCVDWLEKNNIVKYFSIITTKEDSVSKVEKFNLILNKLNIKAEDTYFVTDTIGDLLEANQLNIKTFCVTWGIHKREDFLKYSPYKIIDSTDELLSSFL